MISLLSSEFLRMISRRMLAVIVTAAVTGIVIASVILAVKSHRPTPAQLAQAGASYKSDMKSCLTDPTYGPSDSDLQQMGQTRKQFCDSYVQLANYTPSNQYSLVSLADALMGSSFILIVAAVMIGASSIGAEWGAGSVPTLLVWESRRLRVLLARLVAVVVTVAVLTIILQVALAAALWAVAATRGTTQGTDSAWLHHLFGVMGRVTLTAVLTSAMGLAVATGGRSTTAALLFLVGYLAIFESLLRGLRPTITPWLLASSIATYVSGQAQHVFQSSGGEIVVTVTHSLIVVCAYVAGLLVLAMALFQARDIT